MATGQANQVAHCLRTLALHQHRGAGDGDLLDLYVRQKDEVAFEALVRRHGPMVLGVCRRVLRHEADAEDAFQATFLVLVRKAAGVRPPGLVGNWLYGVAYRTALAARKAAAKRRAKEARVIPRTETPADSLGHLRPLLDRELDLLSDKYRAALVLCDLEGRTRKETARLLGLPEGTVASRLGRARGILAKRLTRRGVALTGGALAEALAQDAASAGASPELVTATVRAATAYAAGPAAAAGVVLAQVAALTEGMVKAMLLTRLKIAVVFLGVLVATGIGLGGLSYRTQAGDRPAGPMKGQRLAQAVANQSGTVPPGQVKADEKGKKAPDLDQAKQALEMVLKGLQPYQASKGQTGERSRKDASDPNAEAFLKAFQIANELARAKGKKSPDQDPAKQILEMVRKGFEARQASNGQEGKRPEKDASDQYAEAFLTAFQIASEIARAKGKGQAKQRPEDQDSLANYGASFLKAYERAEALKNALQGQKATDGKRGEEALEALDLFLEAGREFKMAVKLPEKALAVQRVRQEIESALSRLEETAHDRRTQLEMLEEIARAVQEMRKKIQSRKDRK